MTCLQQKKTLKIQHIMTLFTHYFFYSTFRSQNIQYVERITCFYLIIKQLRLETAPFIASEYSQIQNWFHYKGSHKVKLSLGVSG
jgi:hypothetical protein